MKHKPEDWRGRRALGWIEAFCLHDSDEPLSDDERRLVLQIYSGVAPPSAATGRLAGYLADLHVRGPESPRAA
jgi:hypothetical protein